MLSTRTWLPATVPVSDPSTYVDYHAHLTELPTNNLVLQILKVVEIEKASDIRRPYIKQLLTKDLKFPLPHRVNKTVSKKIFAAHRPSTFF